MFNLEQSIANWRRQLITAGIDRAEVLDELESHLREDLESQLGSDADTERAFTAAAKRMGTVDTLKLEFKKNAQERKWNLLRAGSIVGKTVLVYSALLTMWMIKRRAGEIKITNVELLLALGSMLPAILSGLMGRRAGNLLPVVFNEWRQATFVLVAIFLAGASLRLFWTGLSFDDFGRSQVLLLWTVSPLTGVGPCFSAWNNRCYAARARLKV